MSWTPGVLFGGCSKLLEIGAVLTVVAMAGPVGGQELTPREIAAAVEPAVVQVEARSGGLVVSSGTGFLVHPDGTLVTNRHVVEGATTLSIELATGEIYDNVYVIGDDPRRDLVILRVPATSLPVIPLGNDRDLRVGDPVFVMGNPMGLTGTFSDGLVSALRNIQGATMIQMTAPISPGSSGGPVLNASGEVIGVATLTASEGQNLNMALPIRYVQGLLALPAAPEPFDRIAARFGIPDNDRRPRGVDLSTLLDPSDGQDLEPWAMALVSEMVAFEELAAEEGLLATHEAHVDFLDEGESHDVSLQYSTKHPAVGVFGLCDGDCTDLDLAVFDASGVRIAVDDSADTYAGVSFPVRSLGDYTIRVTMYRCDGEPCAYVLLSYHDPSDLPRPD